jgi:hypothetical protein
MNKPMALETEHLFTLDQQGEPRADFESQTVSRMGSDSMKAKYNLEPICTAIFLSREEWIRDPRVYLIYI